MASSSQGMVSSAEQPLPSLCDFLDTLSESAGLLERCYDEGQSIIKHRFRHRNHLLAESFATLIQQHLDEQALLAPGVTSGLEEIQLSIGEQYPVKVSLQWIGEAHAVITTSTGIWKPVSYRPPFEKHHRMSVDTVGLLEEVLSPGLESMLSVAESDFELFPETSAPMETDNHETNPFASEIPPEPLLRSFDWSKTPIGPMHSWSPALRITMQMVSAMPFPVSVVWGPSRTLLYNQLYENVLVGRGQEIILGKQFREAWPELWEASKPTFDAVSNGHTIYMENQPVKVMHQGAMREFFYTFSLIPIREVDGSVAGILCPSFETTRLVTSERRVASLHELLVATSSCTTPAEPWEIATKCLSSNKADITALSIFSVHATKRTMESDGDWEIPAGSLRLKMEATSGLQQVPELAESDLWLQDSSWNVRVDAEHHQGDIMYQLSYALAVDRPVYLGAQPEQGWENPMVIIPVSGCNANATAEYRMVMIVTLSNLLEYDQHYVDYIGSISDILSSRVSALYGMQTQIQTAQDALEAEAWKNSELNRAIQKTTSALRASERRFMAAFEATPAGLWMSSEQGEILYTNTAHTALIGPLVGKSPDEWIAVVHPEDRESTMRTMMNAAKEDCTSESRIYKVGADRTSLDPASFNWVQYKGGPTYDDNGKYLFSTGSTIDITMRKEYEKTLMKQATDAQELQRKQEYFMDMISHELRNPLGGISLAIDSIVGRLQDLSVETGVDVSLAMDDVGCLQVSCLHMRRLIDDVLSLSKIESELLSICPQLCLPVQQIQEVFRCFRPELDLERITYSVEESPSFQEIKEQPMFLDGARVQQILINLVSNAIKFSRDASHPHLTISLSASPLPPWAASSPPCPPTSDPFTSTEQYRRAYLTFSVLDTGVGLKPDQIERLFKRFSQLAPTFSIKVGGSGLGLFICKRLSWLLGGDIRARALSKGSVFEFFIETYILSSPSPSPQTPLRSPMMSVPGTPGVRRGEGVRSVLVVEDNRVNQQLEKRQLQRAGYEVSTADDGVQAIEYILQSRAVTPGGPRLDCVLMDIEMPNKGGLECTRELRAMQSDGRIINPFLIIGVSANVREGQVRKILDAGMDGFIPKPFRISDIIHKIEEIVAARQEEEMMSSMILDDAA